MVNPAMAFEPLGNQIRPVPGVAQLLQQMPLLVRRPVLVQLLLHGVVFLKAEADGVPARHDVVRDDAAQRVRHNGNFAPSLLKVGVARAKQAVQSVQLLCQSLRDLHRKEQTSRVTFHLNVCQPHAHPLVLLFSE